MVKINPDFQNLIPKLTEDEYFGLEQSILVEGVRDPILTWNGFIVDGHNRYEIAKKHGLEFKTKDKDFVDEDEVKLWMINNQFSRRNLNIYQR